MNNEIEILSTSITGEAFLVGSFARGDYDESSDVDIYVRTPQEVDSEITIDGKVREVDLFSPEDMSEDIDSFEDGLKLFPEAKQISEKKR